MSQQKLAIVGGGQLGRMLALAAIPLGYKVSVLDAMPNCPASVCAEQVIGAFNDKQAVLNFAQDADFVTFEIESANAEAMQQLVDAGKVLNPLPQMLALIKDKFQQKVFYQQHHIPCAESLPVDDKHDLATAAKQFGFPFVLKARFDAYDGRGNAVIKNEDDLDAAFEKLGGKQLYAEKFVLFEKELSVIVARGLHGHVVSYPVVETIHKNNICHTVLCPAPIAADIATQATTFALNLVQHLEGAGVFAVEMFLTKTGEVLVNETAPRVHNSGHHTIEACVTSQFEQHVRAVTGLPLGDTTLKVPAAVMVNILGERQGPAEIKGLTEALGVDGVSVHFYGKAETKPERKMGHITAVADTLVEAQAKAEQARALLSI